MSRMQQLIERLEAGQDPTRDELRRVALLQALDVARAGELFVEQAQQREDEADERTRQLVGY
jgi:hypothetical protein